MRFGKITQVQHVGVAIGFDELLFGVALRERSAGPGDEEEPARLLADQAVGVGNRTVLGKADQLVATAKGDQFIEDILGRTVVAVHRIMVLADNVHVFVAGIPIGQIGGSARREDPDEVGEFVCAVKRSNIRRQSLLHGSGPCAPHQNHRPLASCSGRHSTGTCASWSSFNSAATASKSRSTAACSSVPSVSARGKSNWVSLV